MPSLSETVRNCVNSGLELADSQQEAFFSLWISFVSVNHHRWFSIFFVYLLVDNWYRSIIGSLLYSFVSHVPMIDGTKKGCMLTAAKQEHLITLL